MFFINSLASLYWKLYSVIPKPNPESPVGYIEELQEININETLPSWNATTLYIPARTYEYGIYKAVFRFGVDYLRDTFTIINLTLVQYIQD